MQLRNLACVPAGETHTLLTPTCSTAAARGHVLEVATLWGTAKMPPWLRLPLGTGNERGICEDTQQSCYSKGGAQDASPCSGLLKMLLCLVRQGDASRLCSMPLLPTHP